MDNKRDWPVMLFWSLFALGWLALIVWRFTTWVANNPQFNH